VAAFEPRLPDLVIIINYISNLTKNIQIPSDSVPVDSGNQFRSVIPVSIPGMSQFRAAFPRNALEWKIPIWQTPLPNLIPPEFPESPGIPRIPGGIRGGQ
jgi:hypothetical protein